MLVIVTALVVVVRGVAVAIVVDSVNGMGSVGDGVVHSGGGGGNHDGCCSW